MSDTDSNSRKFGAAVAVTVAIGVAVYVGVSKVEDRSTGQEAANRTEIKLGNASDERGTGSWYSETDVSDSGTPAASDDRVLGESLDRQVTIAFGGSWEDNSCTWQGSYVTLQATGETIEAQKCVRDKPKVRHPYDDYPDESLKALSYGDPIAAIVLGKRLFFAEDTSRSRAPLDMMIRASALLGGKTLPIEWIENNKYSEISVNGVPNGEAIETRYMLKAQYERLGKDTANPEAFRDRVSAVYEISDEDAARLNSAADALLVRMRTIQEDVMGTS